MSDTDDTRAGATRMRMDLGPAGWSDGWRALEGLLAMAFAAGLLVGLLARHAAYRRHDAQCATVRARLAQEGALVDRLLDDPGFYRDCCSMRRANEKCVPGYTLGFSPRGE
jgi:hypothetical protein